MSNECPNFEIGSFDEYLFTKDGKCFINGELP